MLAIWQQRWRWNSYVHQIESRKNGCDDEQPIYLNRPHLCPGIWIVDRSRQCAVIWFRNKL
jgi:hypothetical protein